MAYQVTEADLYVVDEFMKKPIGHHSPDLQRVLNTLRGADVKGKHCLVCTKPGREWQLAQLSGVRGKPVKLLDKTFDNIEDAERYVFRLRWKQHTGKALPE
ncbi:MAG: hypothetical protein OXO52_01705 [Rhodospirillales bacterium]|nr:hypothetical protein [Rhodospirillales bacterium]MDE0379525.1 hypothetical protein [Rhodospirillales bacterium]